MKDTKNMFAAWGGIAGCQHGFELMFSEASEGGKLEKDLAMFSAVLARNVARRFRIEDRKGLLAAGRDADFSIVRFGDEHEIEAEELWTRHRMSAYVGRTSQVRITHTYLRGHPVWEDGRLTNFPEPGHFLAPTP
jgi:allantoinase